MWKTLPTCTREILNDGGSKSFKNGMWKWNLELCVTSIWLKPAKLFWRCILLVLLHTVCYSFVTHCMLQFCRTLCCSFVAHSFLQFCSTLHVTVLSHTLCCSFVAHSFLHTVSCSFVPHSFLQFCSTQFLAVLSHTLVNTACMRQTEKYIPCMRTTLHVSFPGSLYGSNYSVRSSTIPQIFH